MVEKKIEESEKQQQVTRVGKGNENPKRKKQLVDSTETRQQRQK